MIRHYLTTALRNYRRGPVATVMKLVALSLGLACFVGAYTVSDYFAGYDSQWANAGRIFAISQDLKGSSAGFGMSNLQVSAPVAKHLRTDAPELEAMARTIALGNLWTRIGEKAEQPSIVGADADFLKIFNLPFVAGDPLKALSAPKSAVITAAAAERLFGTTDVLGQTLNVNQAVDLTITGVIADIPPPSSFGKGLFSSPSDLLVSMDAADDIMGSYARDMKDKPPPMSESDRWGVPFFRLFVLLPKDTPFTRGDLERRLEGFGARHIPTGVGDVDFHTAPLNRFAEAGINAAYLGGKLGMSFTTVLYLLGALVLGVACLDFANLATAEAGARAKEIGMRKTMGATRGQISVQTMVEVGLLTGLSLVIALVTVGMAISTYNHPVDIGMHMPGLERFDFWAGIVALLIGVTLVAGFYPALVLARIRPVFAIRMGAARGGSRWLRAILIGAQFAATSFLVVAVAAIFIQNARLRDAGLGRTTDPVLNIETSLVSAGIDPDTFRSQIAVLPGVKSYSSAGVAPIYMVSIATVRYSTSPDPSAKQIEVNPHGIDYGLFKTLGVRVLAGREFSRDLDPPTPAPRPGGEQVAGNAQTRPAQSRAPEPPGKIVIDRSTAAALGWTPQEAIGKTIYARPGVNPPDGNTSTIHPETIVGVVADGAVQFQRMGPQFASYQLNVRTGYPVIRISRTDIPATIRRIEQVWDRLAPGMPVRHEFFDDAFNRFYAMYSRISRASTILALTAIVISAMGLIGMATFIVGRRHREIGVRKTLGASTRQVLHLLLWEFSKPVIIGNLIAWPAAFFAVQVYLDRFVVRASLTPVPFLVGLAVTLGIAWLSVGAQALRAARLKPSQVLRYE